MSKDFDIHEWRLYQSNLNLLNEEEDNDWEFDVSNNWGVTELGVGDYITPDMWSDKTVSVNGFDFPEDFHVNVNETYVIKDIHYTGNNHYPVQLFDGGKVEIFDMEILNSVLKPQFQVVPSLNEQDDEWDITTDAFDVTELGVGDILSSKMFVKRGDAKYFLGDKPKLKITRFGEYENSPYGTVYVKFTTLDTNVPWNGAFVADVNSVLKPQYKIVPSLTEQEDDDEWNITTNAFDVIELGIGDVITPDMIDIPSNKNAWNTYQTIFGGNIKKNKNWKAEIVRFKDNGFTPEGKGMVVVVNELGFEWVYGVKSLNNILKPQYKIVPSDTDDLFEQEEDDDWNITVGKEWEFEELGVGDTITREMWKDPEWNYYTKKGNVKIADVGYVNYDDFDDFNYVILVDVNNEDNWQEYEVDYVNNMLKYPYQIVQPLTEQEDDEWDFDVSDNWDITELGKGDIITPNMWNKNLSPEYGDIETWIDDPTEDQIIDNIWIDDHGVVGIWFTGKKSNIHNAYSLTDFNNLLDPKYKIVSNRLDEIENDEWDFDVSDNWDITTLTTGDYLDSSNIKNSNTKHVYLIGDFINDKVELYKGIISSNNVFIPNTHTPGKFPVSMVSKLLKPGFVIEPPNINESDDDEWEFDVSDKWNIKELTTGDVITPDMWDMDKIEVESDSIIRDKKWFINPHKISKFRETRYVDIIEFDGKKELSKHFVEKWLKDNFKINFDGLNEQEDDEWEFDVSNRWNEWEGEFVLTYKVEDEGYVYVSEEDDEEFNRLNPGARDNFSYDDEPIRVETTYKSIPVNIKNFMSEYEDNTGITLSPYTEELTIEGFKKWLKNNNWDNEEFMFLYELFSPSIVKEEYYDEYRNPVRITDGMKKRMNFLDDVTGVEVVDVKFLG